MKKSLVMALSIALIAVMLITGTLAYLTDRDGKANVFTVGNVDIELTEDFLQGSELIPGVDINKDVQIKNIGKNDAWVWYTYAVPTTLVDTGNNASKNAIHFNLEGDYWDLYASDEQKATGKTWHWEDIKHNQTIDDSGIPYTVVTVLYNTTLTAGETTPVSLTNVYLDTRVDIDPDGNMYWVENGAGTDLNWNVNTNGAPKVYVAAYAMQKEEFSNVREAYAAYNTQWGENGGAEYTNPTVVNSTEELKEAVKIPNSTVWMTAGTYELSNIAEGVTIIGSGDVTVTNTLTGTLKNTTIKNVTFSANNAQRWSYSYGDLVFENCTFDAKSVYAIHYDGLNGANITYKDCTINGWAAIGGGANHVTFDGCNINGNGTYGVIRLYSEGTITNCTFDVDNVNTTDAYQDGIHAVDCNVDVENCTNVNGQVEDLFNVSGTGTITVK